MKSRNDGKSNQSKTQEVVQIEPSTELLEHEDKTEPVALQAENASLIAEKRIEIRGNLDVIRDFKVVGWAAVVDDFSKKLNIEILDGDEVVAWGVADIFRNDVKMAKYGDGTHGFAIPLPASVFDGNVHNFVARVVETGTFLNKEALTFASDSQVQGAIWGLDGLALTGGAVHVHGGELDVSILEGGNIVATARTDGNGHFRAQLPAGLFDGRVHLFSARTLNPEAQFAEMGLVVPYVLTPEDALQRWTTRFDGSLSKSAALRYESLRDALVLLGDEEKPEVVRAAIHNMAIAHEEIIKGFANRAMDDYRKLEFPKVAQPLVSVVIPVHNKFSVTYNGLASLLVAPNKASFEVILVDDGSSDETLELADLVKGITIVRHEVAQGFVRSCNHGGTLARGQYIVMLNNDVEVASGWIDEMVRVFDNFDNVGMAGAKLLYPNGTLQEAGGIVWGNGNPWNYGRNGNPHDPRYNYVRQVDYISGACIMLRTKLWADLGGFDEHFAPAYYEDTDLAFRVRSKGLKTVYTPFSRVIHFEGVSSGTSVTSGGAKKYQLINEPKFKRRWAQAYRGNGEVGQKVELAKDRNVNFRVLVIDAVTPRPDNDAGSYAAIQEMRLLQAHGCKLTFVPENMAYMANYTEDMQRMGVECLYAPFYSSVNEIIEKRGAEFDIFYITRFYVASKVVEAIRQHAPKAKIVFNNADLHFLRQVRAAIANKSGDLMNEALRTRDEELSVMRKVDLVLSYNDVEHAVVTSHNLDSTRLAKCPWVVETLDTVTPFEQRKDIAFLGGYGHTPNVEAVEYFAKEIMPRLRKKLPGVRFLIYGSNTPASFDLLEAEDVVIKGYARTVYEVMDSCRVFIAPLLTGAGLKGKVVAAMSHGVPSVLSPVAAEGTGIRNGLEALVASKPDEWVEAIAALYNDKNKWEKMSQAARDYTRDAYSFETGRKLMEDALTMVDIYPYADHQTLVSRKY